MDGEEIEPAYAAADRTAFALRERLIATLEEQVPRGPVALLDFPAHQNVGDLAIWLGELAWAEATGRRVSYVCADGDYSPSRLREHAPEGAILLHGGGNLGDLYPRHDRLRRQVLADFPDRTVVQLPQTIFYKHRERFRETARSLRAHPDFRLLVRDSRSAEIARSGLHSDPVLCPDPAFALGPLRKRDTGQGVLALLRQDAEARHGPSGASFSHPQADWPRWIPVVSRAIFTLSTRSTRLTKEHELAYRLVAPGAWHGYRRFADRLLNRGLSIVRPAKVVVTDRLHGHIFCLLLGMRNVILDNSYGKLSAFYETWTTGSPLVRQASDLGSALEIAEEWAGVA